MSQFVKGFGCRPVVDLYSRVGGRRPKASEERTRGGWWVVGRLWGFDWAAAWAGEALAGVVEGKLALTVANWSPLPRSTSWF